MQEIFDKVVKITVDDIKRVQAFKLTKKEQRMYWLSYGTPVPQKIQHPISRKVFSQTKVRVCWITDTEVQIILHE